MSTLGTGVDIYVELFITPAYWYLEGVFVHCHLVIICSIILHHLDMIFSYGGWTILKQFILP